MPHSRRQFLQMAGIALLSPALPTFNLPARAEMVGRTLHAVPVYRQPRESAVVIRRLWPDQLLPITPPQNGWIQIEGGFIHTTDVQPILLEAANPTQSHPQPPFWAEVCAPVTSVHQWCAADAPLVTRIGHGGSLQVIDYLPGPVNWVGVAGSTGNLLGWTQAAHWTPIRISEAGIPLRLTLDPQNQRLRVQHDEQTLLEAAVATGTSLAAGAYPLQRGPIGGRRTETDSAVYEGLPWNLVFGDQSTLSGVYWHNTFGTATPGPAVQVPTYLARWLYAHAGPGSQLTVLASRQASNRL